MAVTGWWKSGVDNVVYFSSNHGEYLGRATFFIGEDGAYKDKDGHILGEGNGKWISVPVADVVFHGREITEEQAREWVLEMGHNPDAVFDF